LSGKVATGFGGAGGVFAASAGLFSTLAAGGGVTGFGAGAAALAGVAAGLAGAGLASGFGTADFGA
jgi:hypothetical protein